MGRRLALCGYSVTAPTFSVRGSPAVLLWGVIWCSRPPKLVSRDLRFSSLIKSQDGVNEGGLVAERC